MWKCPVCETLNDAEECAVCGEKRPVERERYVPPRPVPPRPTPPRPVPPSDDDEKTKKGYLIIAILTAVLVMLVAVITIVIATEDDGDEPEPTEVVYVTEAPTETVTQIPTHSQTQRPIRTVPPAKPTPVPTLSPSEIRAQKKADYYAEAAEIAAYESKFEQSVLPQGQINYESGVIYDKWDTLLNDVYKYLKQIMSASEFASLEKDEVNWIIEKEAAADEAAAEFEGGSAAPMAWNLTAAEYTEKRTYYLIGLID